MSRLISLILLAILMLPLATVVYLVLIISCFEIIDYSYGTRFFGYFFAGGGTWGFIALYWWLLWRRSVKWTAHRVAMTFAGAGGAAVAGIIAAVLLSVVDEDFGTFMGTVIAPLLWLVGTVFIWRETAAERAERVGQSGRHGIVCPTCGYNLTGLNGTRCPECGTQYTLDDLLARQPGREEAEISA